MKTFNDILIGVATADALGVPFENLEQGAYGHVDQMYDSLKKRHPKYEPHGQPKGSWSDDTSLTLVLMRYLKTIDLNKYHDKGDLNQFMADRTAWLRKGEFTPFGETFGTGSTTRQSVANFENGYEPENCGLTDDKNNGNGTLMTLSAFAYWVHKNELSIHDMVFYLKTILSTSHNTDLNLAACSLYVMIIDLLLYGMPFEKAYMTALMNHTHMTKFRTTPLSSTDIETMGETLAKIRDGFPTAPSTSGFVMHSFEAAIFCIKYSNSYREAIETAVNMGGDVDSIAAIAAPIATILWGLDDVEDWISDLAAIDMLNEEADKFQ